MFLSTITFSNFFYMFWRILHFFKYSRARDMFNKLVVKLYFHGAVDVHSVVRLTLVLLLVAEVVKEGEEVVVEFLAEVE